MTRTKDRLGIFSKTNIPPKRGKRNKYNAKKTECDGHVFDSKGEALRYKTLKRWEDNRLISDLVLQPVFILQKKFERNGKNYRDVKFIADFQYIKDGRIVVEDFKGSKLSQTDVSKLKIKWFLGLEHYKDIDFQIIWGGTVKSSP